MSVPGPSFRGDGVAQVVVVIGRVVLAAEEGRKGLDLILRRRLAKELRQRDLLGRRRLAGRDGIAGVPSDLGGDPGVRMISGSQPVPAIRRSASRAMSPFFKPSSSRAVSSPLASRTAARIFPFVTRPK